MGQLFNRINYLSWAAIQGRLSRDVAWPACNDENTTLVRRKYLVTTLRECLNCGLRFRCPKGDPESNRTFYTDESYKQDGLTTSLPSPLELRKLLDTGFAGSEKDFASHIRVLKENGLANGATILDFGSSWGYGSWQLRRAGFRVFSYEIGKQRARYARDRLQCEMVEDLRTLDGVVDCFFNAHVIEHLANPNVIFEVARKALISDGLLVCYCPNGAPESESARGSAYYDKHWGVVHPLMITPRYMSWAAQTHGFEAPAFRSEAEGLSGGELLTLARKAG